MKSRKPGGRQGANEKRKNEKRRLQRQQARDAKERHEATQKLPNAGECHFSGLSVARLTLLHPCFSDSAPQPPDISTQDAMNVDANEVAAPTAVGIESGAF